MEALFSEHYQDLCLTAKFILTDAEAAKDIVQQFFFHCWNKRAELGLIHDFKHYATRAVKNACFTYLKQSRKKIPYDSLFGNALFTDDNAEREDRLDRADMVKALWEAIGRLPEQRRIIFLLSNMEGLSYVQVAQKLDISVNTVKTQIRLAYQFLRQECNWGVLAWIILFLNNFL